ncbi:hypothetical protein [Legionella gratiana]|uniref:hypothetical protein n=1 Tax=Legionella gratiana TaxID=45066 RepID=UPI000A6E9DA9|nr:hypothetical protein [Legionella gratiana]
MQGDFNEHGEEASNNGTTFTGYEDEMYLPGGRSALVEHPIIHSQPTILFLLT